MFSDNNHISLIFYLFFIINLNLKLEKIIVSIFTYPFLQILIFCFNIFKINKKLLLLLSPSKNNVYVFLFYQPIQRV